MSDAEQSPWEDAARERLGVTLAAWMAYYGLKKAVLSRKSGLGRNTIDQALNGGRIPKLETLAALAEALDTTVGALLDGTMPPAGVKPPGRLGSISDERSAVLLAEITALQRLVATQSARLATAIEILSDQADLPAPAVQRLHVLRQQLAS